MNKIKQNWSIILAVIFFIVTWCYWWLEYPALMVFREQIQMFLFNGSYFTERAVYPAGLARYAGEFMTQFFNRLYLGAFVIALLAMALQLLTKVICNASTANAPARKTVNDYLSYYPVLVLLYFLGNENVNLAFPVAILILLLGIWGYTALQTKIWKWVYVIIATPVLYWMAGPVVLMLPVYITFAELINKEKILPAAAVVYAIALICLSTFFVKAPFYRLWYGIGYSILVAEFMPMQVVIPCFFAIMPAVAHFLPEVKEKHIALVNVIATSAVLAVVVFWLPKGVEKIRYEIFEYDVLVRSNKWDDIIRKAEKKNPETPLSVASLNLALAMEGQLIDRGGQFFQNGVQGAFPLFNKNFLFSLMTSEVYFNVGLINTAQRYAFEAQETIPDGNKSARIMKRLVETNIINGDYKVARKYIDLLKQTMFYAKWAERQEMLLGDENAINNDPLYGHMRKVRLQHDFIFSEQEIDKIMGQLIMQNPQNAVAQQYLLFLPMLEGNRQKYATYSDFLQKALKGEINTDSLSEASARPRPELVEGARLDTAGISAQTNSAQVDGYTSATPKQK